MSRMARGCKGLATAGVATAVGLTALLGGRVAAPAGADAAGGGYCAALAVSVTRHQLAPVVRAGQLWVGQLWVGPLGDTGRPVAGASR